MSKKTTPPVILIGMHRSGTTLLSNQLKQLGLFTGKSLGIHGEAQFYVKLNDWLLSQTAANWDEPHNVETVYDAKYTAEYNSFIDYLKIVLKSPLKYKFLGFSGLFKTKKLWGFKDPVNSLTLPFWLSIYPDAKVIFIKRHGIDVSNSLVTRNKNKYKKSLERLKTKKLYPSYLIYNQFFKKNNRSRGFIDCLKCKDLDHGIYLWDYYNDKCYEYLKKVSEDHKHEVVYENFLENPKDVLLGISKFLNIKDDVAKIDEISKDINAGRAYSYKNKFEVKEISKYKEVLEKHGYKP